MDGQWRDLKVREENIKVKGSAPVLFKVYETHRGPVFTREDKDSAEVLF